MACLVTQIGVAIFVIEVLLMAALSGGSLDFGALPRRLIEAAFLTVFSSPIVYLWIVRPFIASASRANEAVARTAQALDSALQAKNAQAEALAATLARLKLQTSIIDRLAIISETDPRGVITEVNDNFCRVSGYPREELIGNTHALVNSGFHPKSFWKDMFSTMARGEVWQAEVRNRAKNGSYYWVHCINSAMRDGDGKLRGYMSLRMDITENKRQQALLSAQNVKLDAALGHMSQGLVMFDGEKRVVMCNDKYAQMYALPPDLCAPGTPLAAILEHRFANGIYQDEAPAEYRPENVHGVALVAESVHKLANGHSITVVRRPMENGGWVSTHEDITHRLRLEDRIAHLALHDGLTDLPNRTLLRERLEHALLSAHASESVAVLCLDLDRFKEVNDTLGHAVGDTLLQAVAERLKSCVRKTDTVARIGGDEFVVVQVSADPLKEAAVLSERFLEKITAPYELGGHHVIIGTSIGIAVSPRDGTDQDKLLQNADIALYRSKTAGRGTYHFFEQEMNEHLLARRSLERDLRRALVKGEFELHYQPILNLKRNAIGACEALLRWRHPERGLIPPSEFIPLAEETGLIAPIGDWVLRHACAEARNWPADVKVAINLSAIQFKSPMLPKMILNALTASGLAANRLEIEVTENVLLKNSENVIAILEEIHRMGARVTLDDFGAGYSSLSYLRTFRFDKIKIDRCFIADLTSGNEAARAIVRAITSLGCDLGIATVAEGVETEAQLQRVRQEGMSEIQGFLFGEPAPAAKLRRMFAERTEWWPGSPDLRLGQMRKRKSRG
jgi:diguanylate cyclase (GGDEF)-like protein/PAS domain S-box-containing protein